MQSDRQKAVYARRVRLSVAPAQRAALDEQSKLCNRLYNDLLDIATKLRAHLAQAKASGDQETIQKLAGDLYGKRSIRNLVPGHKEAHPFLKAVHSSPLKNTALRLSRAINERRKSRKGLRAGPAIDWPRFKSMKKDWFSIEYDEPKKGWSVSGRILKLSLGVGSDGKRLPPLELCLVDQPKKVSAARCCRIVKDAGHYYAIFTMERQLPRRKTLSRIAYIDPNSKNLGYMVGTDGQAVEFANTPGLANLERTTDKITSKRDRCLRRARLVEFQRQDGSTHRHWEPSRRWKKYDAALKRAQMVKRDRIKHHHYALANRLFRSYDLVGIGDFAPANADSGLGRKANRTYRNNRHLGQLRQVLSWVAMRSGKGFEVMDERGTTRTCHDCGYVVDGGIPPKVREWDCPGCGTVHGRDENAAKNGLERLCRSRNLQLPSSGPGALLRCKMAFRPDGRWEIAGLPASASMNQTAASEITEARLALRQMRHDCRRSIIGNSDIVQD